MAARPERYGRSAPAERGRCGQSLWIGLAVEAGDWLSHTTIVVLAIMSVGTWYILIMRLVDQTILMRQANSAQKSFWAAGSLKEGMSET